MFQLSSHIRHGDVFGFLCWYILLFRAHKAFMQPSFCLHALLSLHHTGGTVLKKTSTSTIHRERIEMHFNIGTF